MAAYLILDLETENHPYFGAVASPRHPDNYVVLNGWRKDEIVDGKIVPGQIEHFEGTNRNDKWLHIPDDVVMLVAHNAAFELDWMLVQQRDEIMRFLKRGGRVFCTSYAQYLLSHQLETYPDLETTAQAYGGTAKVDGIKIQWKQGKLTSQIDREELRRYLIDPQEGDVANTALAFYAQMQLLLERGMWGMALDRMEGLLFNVLAMDSGLKIDYDVAMAQLAASNAKLEEYKKSFQQMRTGLPDELVFNESSDYHMSAWLFGGPVKYRARVPALNDDGTPKYEKVDCYQFGTTQVRVSDFDSAVEASSRECVAGQLEAQYGAPLVYKSGKNKGQLKEVSIQTSVVKTKWGEQVHHFPGVVSIKQMPDDIQDAMSDEFTGKRTLCDGTTPVYSTSGDCLKMFAVLKSLPEDVRKVFSDLVDYFKIDKDVGTYYLREEFDDDGNVVKQSGMLQYMNEKHFVHHTLNATSTVTGRLSSNRPNFQNLPRGGTSEVKKMFVSRFGADGFIVEADYSALEVVTLAAFSKDAALCRALLEGIDMHCMRLAQQLKEPYEDVLRKCKDADHPDHKKYSEMRTDIKPKAFSYQYGATARGIAYSTGCTVEEAQAFIDAEKALFPEVEAFYDNTITPTVNANATTHREEFNGGWTFYKRGHWQAPGGTCYSFRQYPKTVRAEGKRIQVMEFRPTQLRNYPIQGESGFFVQGVCGRIARWLIANDFFGGKVFIVNTVHDAVYFDCHKDVLDVVCAGVKQIMEDLPNYFNTVHGYDLQVPFPAAVEFGRSMFEKIHWHPGVLDDPKTQETLGWVRSSNG